MSAVFPRGIKSFTTKRNLLDDVDAGDINTIQDEIVALESTLGELINDVEELVSDVDQNEEDDEGQDRTLARFRIRFASLKDRIDYIHAGRQLPAIVLASATGETRPVFQGAENDKPAPLNFAQPSNWLDTHDMYNGIGFTTKQSGFWIINGFVRYDLAVNGANNTDNRGMYGATIMHGDNFKRALVRQNPAEKVGTKIWNVTLHPTLCEYLPRGTRISLRTHQQTTGVKHVNGYSLSGIMIRRLGDGFSQPETSNNRFIL